MKLPWDEKYLKISFHVIFTAIVIYILAHLINIGAYIFSHVDEIFSSVSQIFSRTLSIFSILVVALIISYLLDPFVSKMQLLYESYVKKTESKNRTAGTVLVYLIIFFALSLFIFIAIKKIDINTNKNFVDNFSATIVSTVNEVNESYSVIQEKLKEWGVADYISDFVNATVNALIKFFRGLSTNIINIVASAGSKILDLSLSLVIAFYLLRDKKHFQQKVSNLSKVFLPKKVYLLLKNIFGDINAVFSGYVSGQLMDALIMVILLSLWLRVVHIKFAVIIGVFSGFANIIPYFGAFAGFILSIISAVIEGDYFKALYAALGVMVLQQVDGMFIVPKVVGERVEMSPFLVILSLSVAGKLFGILGMILAVPVCAIMKIFASRFVARQKNKMLEQ